MIFSLKRGMYTSLLLGEKTLTTRLKLPAHIAEGKEWAIVPGRAQPAWWFGKDEIVTEPKRWGRRYASLFLHSEPDLREIHARLKQFNFVQARIHIYCYWQNALCAMSEQDARDEGVATLDEYRALWTAINPKYAWKANVTLPVWRIRVGLPDDVADAVARVGREAIVAAAGATL